MMAPPLPPVLLEAQGPRTLRGGAGSLVDHPQLTQLSALLTAIDAGDRIVKGRVELFACSRKSLSQRAQQDLERRVPETITDSPLGPLSTDAARLLLSNLRSLLSLLFVHHDCSAIMPNDFERCHDVHTVVSTINHSLAAVVDRVHSGFLSEFWQTIQETIDVVNCEIFSLRPNSETFQPTDKSLASLYYFFIDPLGGRILFVGCVTKSMGAVRGGVDSDSDVVLSHIESPASSDGQCSGSDMSSVLLEGEFAFEDDKSDGGMAGPVD